MEKFRNFGGKYCGHVVSDIKSNQRGFNLTIFPSLFSYLKMSSKGKQPVRCTRSLLINFSYPGIRRKALVDLLVDALPAD